MKRKIVSIFIVFVVILNLLPVSFVYAVEKNATITISADKTNVKAGETITYTISANITKEFGSMQLDFSIPEGLNYVLDSGKLLVNKTAVGIPETENPISLDMQGPTTITPELKKQLLFIFDKTPFKLTGTVNLATFQCKVTENATGNLGISCDKIVITDDVGTKFPEDEISVSTSTVTATVPVTGVSLDKKVATINVGSTQTLNATIAPESATNKNVTWASSNTEVATVDANGVITGVKIGNAVITVTTQDGNYTDTCNVQVECAHANKTTHEEEPATCKKEGHKRYVQCDDCKEIIEGENSVINRLEHKLQLVARVEPQCNQNENLFKDGIKEHYECTECGTLFDKDNNKKEVTLEELKIKASHVYGNQWIANEADASTHKKVCACGNIITQKHEGGTATCKEKATCVKCGEKYGELSGHSGGKANCQKKAVCTTCGAEYGEIDENYHANTEVRGASSANCTRAGYSGDTYCKDCNKLVKAGSIISATGHKGGTATCSKKAICDNCKSSYGELNPENHVNIETKNAILPTCTEEGKSGTTFCNDCQKTITEETIIPALGHKGGKANCQEPAVCEVCKEKYGEVDSNNHIEVEIRNAVEATKEKEGYTGDKYCKVCNLIVEKGNVIPAITSDNNNNGNDDNNKKDDKQENLNKPTNNSISKDPSIPKTGDNSNIIVWASLLVISGICFIIIIKCKTKKKER